MRLVAAATDEIVLTFSLDLAGNRNHGRIPAEFAFADANVLS
jgi:hypothetical protein